MNPRVRVAMFTVLWTLFAVLGSLIASEHFNGSIPSMGYPFDYQCVLFIELAAGEKERLIM